MMSYLRFNEGGNESEPTSSDEEYDKNEKRLLYKFRNRKKENSESETEVLGVRSESDSSDQSDDNQSDIAPSDVEGQEQNDSLPDVRAWGKEKKKYYGTDYIDADYGGYQEKDVQAAEIEEEEAKNLQKQLVQQLDDNDFSLDVIFTKKDSEEVKVQNEELVKTDLSKLTNKQKLQILQKESPEFFGLVEDFKVKMAIAKDFLQPIDQKVKNGDIETCKAVEFVEAYYHLILNYATNIHMYLLLKINRELKNHPVIQRLFQYRQLLSKMDPVFEDVIKPQIEMLLAKYSKEETEVIQPSLKQKKKKVLKLLQQSTLKAKKTKVQSDMTQPSKKIKLDKPNVTRKVIFHSEDSGNGEDVDLDQNEQDVQDNDKDIQENAEEYEDVGKRAITYQIAKNKGLTPHRKREHRNPRVKHKLKFRKALIRRKGAVREPRKELKRYSGEISGIKASVSKSIKIKS